jgi:tritrans,polycis-undecaprenyl-diphosphate synthase [geranylgeranyl-diphosphate specific]
MTIIVLIKKYGREWNIDVSGTITDSINTARERKYKRLVKEQPVPHHIAIIMDGNRRFAESIGLTKSSGHEKGRDKLEELLSWCLELDIKILTVYAFSTENISRTNKEIKVLMDLFEKNFKLLGDDERVHKNKIRVTVIGDRSILPRRVIKAIKYAENKTKNYENYYFNLAVAYGGREEITQAIQKIAMDAKKGKIKPDKIDQKIVSSYLYTKEFPDPDLVLRTSGEERISNFLLWQLAYSELYFSDVYWPGFRKIDFLKAIYSYQLRKRRFGK